jgi:hypothetical protein
LDLLACSDIDKDKHKGRYAPYQVRVLRHGHFADESCLSNFPFCDHAGGDCPAPGGSGAQLWRLPEGESLEDHLDRCVDLAFLKCVYTSRSLVVHDIGAVRTRHATLSMKHVPLVLIREPAPQSPEVEVDSRYHALAKVSRQRLHVPNTRGAVYDIFRLS